MKIKSRILVCLIVNCQNNYEKNSQNHHFFIIFSVSLFEKKNLCDNIYNYKIIKHTHTGKKLTQQFGWGKELKIGGAQ